MSELRKWKVHSVARDQTFARTHTDASTWTAVRADRAT